jgi:hypothetical protein
MKQYVITLCIKLIILISAQGQEFAWAKTMGSTTTDACYSITVDAAGNQYITGLFTGTGDFDPGPATFNLTSNGAEDVFISKLNASGNLVWAKNIGGTDYDYGRGIAVDVSGNVLVTGSFKGTADFDPGPGVVNISSAGGFDIFICKLDASGNFSWAKKFGDGTDEDRGNAITVDAVGNVYTTGSFKGTIDFDPGGGIANITADYIDVFISKLDVSGNYVWAKKVGGVFTDIGYGIVVDEAGYVYTAGHFRGNNCDYDPGPGLFYLNTFGDSDQFVLKLDSSGNFVWARQVTSPAVYFSYAYSLAVDTSGNIYTTGGFHGTVDFDPGAGVFNMTAQGYTDAFVCKLNSSGDFVWSKIIGGCQIDDYGYSIAVDKCGGVYSSGVFQYIGDFDPGTGTYNLQSAGGTDVYISKLNSAGNFVWAKRVGSGYNDYGIGVAVDTSGNIYTTGQFEGGVDFDPGTGIYNLTSAGLSDIFVSKLNQSVWNGSASNTWSDPANWNSGKVPGITSDVIIQSGLARYPTILSSTEINSLILRPGSTLTTATGIQLTIISQ